VDCGTETPREEMYGPPDELRCRACVQRRFPTTNVPTRHRSSFFRRWPPVTLFAIIAGILATLLSASHVPEMGLLFAYPPAVWDGQVWRLLTSVFLHDTSSPLHIGFNALWMWRLGKPVETWMGSLRYAAFFVAVGTASSAAQFLTGAPGIGLSGVVYALVGFLIVLRREEQFAAELMPPGLIQFFAAWFFICILLTHFGWLPVANAAHGAGAVSGLLFGWAVVARRRVVATAGAALFCIALTAATLYMPWDWKYDLYQGLRYYEANDYAHALVWFERADRRHPGEEELERIIDDTRRRLKARQEDGP
jgi:GlpG protein